MRKNSFLTLLIVTAAITFGPNEVKADISAQISIPVPTVSINIDGYLPPPVGVVVLLDSGRPYYVEREQRIYMKENPEYHHQKGKKHHHDNGHKNGHHK